jgi:hypothetical protein
MRSMLRRAGSLDPVVPGPQSGDQTMGQG